MPTAQRPLKYLDVSIYSSLEREYSTPALFLLKRTLAYIAIPTKTPVRRCRYELIAQSDCTKIPKLSLWIVPGSIEREHSIVPHSRL